MKNSSLILLGLFFLAIAGCSKKADDHAHHHEAETTVATDPNKPLYDSVMAVHDEVMPKMDEMFRLTEALKDKIAKTPTMPDNEKRAIDAAIDSLEQAGDGMMVWMRQFKPAMDTADREGAREYLNQEMVKVTKVKTDILTSIERARSLQ